MRSRIDSMLHEWAEAEIAWMHRSGYSGINVVERLLRNPGRGSEVAEHKVLWWPRNRRVAKVSKASHQLTPWQRTLLIAHYGTIQNDDGTRFEKKDFVNASSLTSRRYEESVKAAKNKMSRILRSYENGLWNKVTSMV